jgi:hypothetical protein
MDETEIAPADAAPVDTRTILERVREGEKIEGVVLEVANLNKDNLSKKERTLNTATITFKLEGGQEITEKVALTSSTVPEPGHRYSFGIHSDMNPEGLVRAVNMG